ncbi:hypothetical protein [Wenyingzhuangia sp. 2_MG-2023]|uniref:hypothetical protein n=1 Tax=Wenyingzhuangia sp. 2_MG-2023 TaxID=3062639 RepID=UPI0026E18E73|nr:hypothetical protein [Wenyingzhuangia sp. 2_MG-2023]MDO6738675.1 hypothetical protein [Wenyingzhuangia sp. 2_MG-2023]
MSLSIQTKLTYILLFINMTLHAQQFDLFKIESKTILNDVKKIEKDYQYALQKQDTTLVVKNLILLSRYHRKDLNYGTAFNLAGEALFLSYQINNKLQLAQAHREQGILNYIFKQDDNAGDNFKKSNLYFKEYYKDYHPDLLNSYFNLALYYQRIENKELLLKYVDTCKTIATKQQLNFDYQIYLKEKIACTYIWDKNYKKAIQLLKKSIQQIEKTTKNNHFLVILYADLGKVYSNINQLDLSEKYFKKSIDTKGTHEEYLFFKAYVYAKYANLLYRKGNATEAYKYLQKSRNINDKYLNPRNEATQSFLTLKDHYRDQLIKSNQQISFQKLKNAQIEQKILNYKICLIVVVFAFVLIGIFIWIKVRSKKHQLEQEEAEKKIEANNKELTVNTLKLIEKEEIINTLKAQLLETDKSSNTKTLIKSIDKNSGNLWEDFNQRFTALNKGFYERLQKKVPNLSAAELKLCALIKLNFTGKEMAYLLGISLGSVNVARHRLRKKIKLDRKTNLTAFIGSI